MATNSNLAALRLALLQVTETIERTRRIFTGSNVLLAKDPPSIFLGRKTQMPFPKQGTYNCRACGGAMTATALLDPLTGKTNGLSRCGACQALQWPVRS